MSEGEQLVVVDNMLFHVNKPRTDTKNAHSMQVVVPMSLRNTALGATHDSLVGGGHMGFCKTYEKVIERWWWSNVYFDVKYYCDLCTTCSQMHHKSARAKGELNPIVVHKLFELIGIDIVGELPRTNGNNRWILVITNHFSKWAAVFPMESITAEAVADTILKQVILAGHGAPARILTDCGSNFNAKLSQEFYRLLRITKSTMFAYHPQCDGHTERFNGMLCTILSKLLAEHPMEWDQLVPFVTFAYNTSVHATTKFHHIMCCMVENYRC